MEKDSNNGTEHIWALQDDLLEEDPQYIPTTTVYTLLRDPNERVSNLDKDQEPLDKEEPELYSTIKYGNRLDIDPDVRPGLSGSVFNMFDIEQEPTELPPTYSIMKRCKLFFSLIQTVSSIRKKPLPRRVFRTLDKGSLRGSIFTLVSSAVGAFVFNLPMVMSYFGLAMGVVVILISSLLAYASYWA
jgi:hypothetical protein